MRFVGVMGVEVGVVVAVVERPDDREVVVWVERKGRTRDLEIEERKLNPFLFLFPFPFPFPIPLGTARYVCFGWALCKANARCTDDWRANKC